MLKAIKIIEACERLKMTAEEIEETISEHKINVGRYVNGSPRFTLDNIDKIGRAFHGADYRNQDRDLPYWEDKEKKKEQRRKYRAANRSIVKIKQESRAEISKLRELCDKVMKESSQVRRESESAKKRVTEIRKEISRLQRLYNRAVKKTPNSGDSTYAHSGHPAFAYSVAPAKKWYPKFRKKNNI